MSFYPRPSAAMFANKQIIGPRPRGQLAANLEISTGFKGLRLRGQLRPTAANSPGAAPRPRGHLSKRDGEWPSGERPNRKCK